jgi:putative glutathione S-transferase
MLEKGWRFAKPDEKLPGENVTPDPLHPDYTHLRDIYFSTDKNYGGRFTVPTLYDKKTNRIVNNESSEIIRMFYYAFDDLIDAKYKELDLFPEPLRSKIDETNEWTYNDINNGVYRSGFATTQDAYEKAVTQLFKSLDRVEEHLGKSEGPYYWGNKVTETDVRLYTTIIRFDPVYVQHFKCNIRDIRSGYPAIHKWVRHLYWDLPAFGRTTQFEHIKKHYTKSHKQINPLVRIAICRRRKSEANIATEHHAGGTGARHFTSERRSRRCEGCTRGKIAEYYEYQMRQLEHEATMRISFISLGILEESC